MATAPLRIRPAQAADLPFVLGLLPRLVAFGPPAWRDATHMTRVDTEVLTQALHQPATNQHVWVAETDQPLGFLHLTASPDYYQQTHAHIADLVVAAEAQGQGVGRALLAFAEQWARTQGYAALTLSVFAQNTYARSIYEQAGFQQDILKYVKPLSA